MSGTGKTARLCARQTSGHDGQQILPEYYDAPTDDFTIEIHPVQGSIASFLGYGKDAARNRSELVRLTGLPARAVTLEIMRERRQGVPILSNPSGYFLPGTASELRDCIERLRSRGREVMFTASCLSRAYLMLMQEHQSAGTGETGEL